MYRTHTGKWSSSDQRKPQRHRRDRQARQHAETDANTAIGPEVVAHTPSDGSCTLLPRSTGKRRSSAKPSRRSRVGSLANPVIADPSEVSLKEEARQPPAGDTAPAAACGAAKPHQPDSGWRRSVIQAAQRFSSHKGSCASCKTGDVSLDEASISNISNISLRRRTAMRRHVLDTGASVDELVAPKERPGRKRGKGRLLDVPPGGRPPLTSDETEQV